MSATLLNRNCVKLIIDYLSPLPKLPFERELLSCTRSLEYNFDIFIYSSLGWKHKNICSNHRHVIMRVGNMWNVGRLS